MAYYMLISFLPCLSLLRLAIWKAEVMATVLGTKMDCEDKVYTLEMLEWEEEGCVPKDEEEQGLYARVDVCVDYSVKRHQLRSCLTALTCSQTQSQLRLLF